ncbi:MAG: hypothetical protein WBI53_09430 [Paludibacter sp.]
MTKPTVATKGRNSDSLGNRSSGFSVAGVGTPASRFAAGYTKPSDRFERSDGLTMR